MRPEKVAIFSVLFPANLSYFSAFLDGLKMQDYSEFELVLILDQINDIDIDNLISTYRDCLTIHTFNFEGSIASIRLQGLQLLRVLSYDYIIFADSDDVLSTSRISTCVKALSRYPLVVNDVAPFKEEGKWGDAYWSDRLGDEFEFTSDDITRYNIVGLGNTSIRKDLLLTNKIEFIPLNIPAPDWFIFYQLMTKVKGIFMRSGCMYYRQHEMNLIGLRQLNKQRLMTILDVKIRHYSALKNSFNKLEKLLAENIHKRQRLMDDENLIEELLSKVNGQQINYFWWEESEYMV